MFQGAVSVKKTLDPRKPTSKTPGRLVSIAEILRLVLKAGVSNIGAKTLTAIVDHITQILPTNDGEFCGPLLHHYLKALMIVFDHQANAERLTEDVWGDIVDFCSRGITQYLDENPKNASGFSRSSSGGLAKSLASRPLAKTSSTSLTVSLTRSDADELLQILHALVSPANAPISARYKEISALALRAWHYQGSSVSQSHQLIFSIINKIVLHMRTDKTIFTQSIAREVMPIISQFWHGKTLAKDEMLNSVRDEMFIFMFTVHPHMERSLRDDEGVVSIVEELSDVLKSDYARRSAKDQMHLDDLTMVDFGAHPMNTPFCLQAIQLRDHNTKSERNWAHLQTIGILERMVNIGQQQASPGKDEDDDELEKHPQKRQRVALSYDRMLEPLKSDDEKMRLSGLQTLPYVLNNRQFGLSELQIILEHLQACSSDKRGEIPSWAMLAISRQGLCIILTFLLFFND